MENKCIKKENFYSLNNSKIAIILIISVFFLILIIVIIVLYQGGFFTHIYNYGFQLDTYTFKWKS